MKVTVYSIDGTSNVIEQVSEVHFTNDDTYGTPAKTFEEDVGVRVYVNPTGRNIAAVEIED